MQLRELSDISHHQRGLAAVQEIEQFVKNDVYVHNGLVSDW